MNERIQQLAEQAKTSVPAGLLVNEWIDEYNRIFAELIVKECIKVLETNNANLTLDFKWDAIHEIETHFEVNDVDTQLRNRSTYFGNNP